MLEEKIAEGTPREWKKYTPEGCGLFFVERELALEWERLSKQRDKLIDNFYKSEPLVSLNKSIERIMQKNHIQIKELSIEYRRKCRF